MQTLKQIFKNSQASIQYNCKPRFLVTENEEILANTFYYKLKDILTQKII